MVFSLGWGRSFVKACKIFYIQGHVVIGNHQEQAPILFMTIAPSKGRESSTGKKTDDLCDLGPWHYEVTD